MSDGSLDDTAPHPRGEAPAQVGRYLLESRARGGGDVFDAYDPELERAVALELVPAGASGEEALRRAQLTARVRHDNVLTIYDVCSAGAERFVARERIDGVTLDEWLKRPRSRRELIAVFVAAARGLRAAHDAGVAHGSFAAASVIVGDDGRACIAELGVADAKPEELRADRDAFLRALTDAFAQSRARLPIKIARLAGTATMTDVLEALAPPRRARWPIAAAAAVAACAAAVVVPSLQKSARVSRCRQSSPLSQLWNAASRARLTSLVGGAIGADRGARVAGAIDAYVRDFVALHDRACEDAGGNAEAQALADLRLECLGERRDELTEALTLLDKPQAARLAMRAVANLRPVDACADAEALRRPIAATAPPALLEPIRTLVARARVEFGVHACPQSLRDAADARKKAHATDALALEAEAALIQGVAEECLGRIDAARVTMSESAILAARAQSDALTVRAYLRLVAHDVDRQAFDEADHSLSQARETMARHGGDARLRAEVEYYECFVPIQRDQYAEAEPHCKEAQKLTAALPARSEMEADLHNAVGLLYRNQGHYADAEREFRRAADLTIELNPDFATAVEQHYACMVMEDEVEQDHLDAALRLYPRCEVHGHAGAFPSLRAYELSFEATMLANAGRAAEALPIARRALAVANGIEGPHDPESGWAYAAMGTAYARLGKSQLAATHLEEALRLLPVTGNQDQRALIMIDLAKALWEATPRHKRALEVAAEARQWLAAHARAAMRERVLHDVDGWLAARRAT
jgi:eukaryotic-like serine/threonine-protein kinase